MHSHALQTLAHQRIQEHLARAEARRMAKLAHPARRHGDDRFRRTAAHAAADPPFARRSPAPAGC